MAASAGKRNVQTPNLSEDETNIQIDEGDTEGIKAVEAGDADAAKVNEAVEADDKDFKPSDPDPVEPDEEIPVNETE